MAGYIDLMLHASPAACWSMVPPKWDFSSGLCQSPLQLQSPGAKCQREKHRYVGQTLWGVMTSNL